MENKIFSLSNPSVLCYANACIQFLWAVPEIADIFLNKLIVYDPQLDRRNSFKQFEDICDKIINARNGSIVNLDTNYNVLKQIYKLDERMQDQNEFFIKFINDLQLFTKITNDFNSLILAQHTDIISLFFSFKRAEYKSYMGPSNSLEVATESPNYELSIELKPFPTNNFIDLLKYNNISVIYDNQVTFRTLYFINLPPYLIFNITTYNETTKYYMKLQNYLNIDLIDLVLSPSLFDPENFRGKLMGTTKYDAISVVIHVGERINYGHYMSISKRNNVWYLFNDDQFSEYNIKRINDQKDVQITSIIYKQQTINN